MNNFLAQAIGGIGGGIVCGCSQDSAYKSPYQQQVEAMKGYYANVPVVYPAWWGAKPTESFDYLTKLEISDIKTKQKFRKAMKDIEFNETT